MIFVGADSLVGSNPTCCTLGDLSLSPDLRTFPDLIPLTPPFPVCPYCPLAIKSKNLKNNCKLKFLLQSRSSACLCFYRAQEHIYLYRHGPMLVWHSGKLALASCFELTKQTLYWPDLVWNVATPVCFKFHCRILVPLYSYIHFPNCLY